MPCLLALLMLAFPRVALVLVWLFTNLLERAYATMLIPVLGFIFLPLTTLVYAYIAVGGHPIAGVYLLYLIVTVLVDLGLLGGGYRGRNW